MDPNARLPSLDLTPAIKVRAIELHTHIHATESREKIICMLQNLFPDSYEESNIHIESCSGAYGQPIQGCTLKLVIQASIKAFLNTMQEKLTPETKRRLSHEFSSRIDEKMRFYFRLDKQKAIQCSFELGSSSDVIQVIISVQNKNPKFQMEEIHVKSFLSQFGLFS